MIQPIRLQGRVPLLALLAVALATLLSISLTRVTSGTAAPARAVPAAIVATELVSAVRPAVQAPTISSATGCSTSTYVSGDLAGDASPTEVYAALCSQR